MEASSSPSPPLSVAVVGSGPAGCYAAERLAREPRCRVDVLDRLPTPFGLIRAGVAPDHQGTKAVSRVLERVLERENVAFHGNVEIGRDLTLDELRGLYDAVVIATGAPLDRRLGVPGEDLAGVVGSAAFVGWYNSHPSFSDGPAPVPARALSAVIVGNGNVALDVARVLAKTPAEMERSDIDPEVQAALAAAPLAEIAIVGRRGAGETGFSVNELSELGRLARAEPVVDPAEVADGIPAPNAAALEVLRGWAARPPEGGRLSIRFRFGLRPLGFAAGEGTPGRLARALFERRDGAVEGIPADLAVTCIGYRSAGCCALAPEDGVLRNEGGRIAEGLYVVGWAKRGPSGTIATNRPDSHAVAERVLAEAAPSGRAGREGLRALLSARGARAVDAAAWKRIGAAEVARAPEGRARRKFTRVEEMLATCGQPR
jgi:ferredoxin--NADP+ reductase